MWLRRSPGGWHVSATLIRGLQLLKQGLDHTFSTDRQGLQKVVIKEEGRLQKAVGMFEEMSKNQSPLSRQELNYVYPLVHFKVEISQPNLPPFSR